VSLELVREIRGRDIDLGIIMKEETGEIRGRLDKRDRTQGNIFQARQRKRHV